MPGKASTKNDVSHQNCLALVSSYSLNQNFLFFYLLIGHFQVSFISAQVFFLRYMCAKRTLTKRSFRPLPVSPSSLCFTSCNNSSSSGEDGSDPATESGLKTRDSFLIPVLLPPLLSKLISSIKYSFHWLQEAGTACLYSSLFSSGFPLLLC